MTASDWIAAGAVAISTLTTVYMFVNTRHKESRDSTETRLNRVEDGHIGLAAQVSVIVGGIQRLDARQERIEDLLFKLVGGTSGKPPEEDERA